MRAVRKYIEKAEQSLARADEVGRDGEEPYTREAGQRNAQINALIAIATALDIIADRLSERS